METVGKIIVGLFYMLTGVLVKGFIILKFWLWFLTHMFGVFAIDFNQAIAVGFLISLFSTDISSGKSATMSELFEKWLMAVVFWFMMLLVGYIAFLFIQG